MDDGINDGRYAFYEDLDEDGFGGASLEPGCCPPVGAVLNDLDCDDGDGSMHPGANDMEDDGIDQDCDGVERSCDGAWVGDLTL